MLFRSAQSNVYSLNVVGYVNVPVPANYSILANPLKAGVTNGANEIMTPIDGQQILTWNGAGYDFSSYDTGYGGWIKDLTGTPGTPPSLPPGKGFFFYNPGAATTVTFVGEVVPAPATTNSIALGAGYSLVGSALPVSGPVTSSSVNLPVIDGFQMLLWNGTGYTFRSYDSGYGGWISDLTGTPSTAPSVNVGQGFWYFNPAGTTNWSQSLP